MYETELIECPSCDGDGDGCRECRGEGVVEVRTGGGTQMEIPNLPDSHITRRPVRGQA